MTIGVDPGVMVVIATTTIINPLILITRIAGITATTTPIIATGHNQIKGGDTIVAPAAIGATIITIIANVIRPTMADMVTNPWRFSR